MKNDKNLCKEYKLLSTDSKNSNNIIANEKSVVFIIYNNSSNLRNCKKISQFLIIQILQRFLFQCLSKVHL
jgi:hypothetical protein